MGVITSLGEGKTENWKKLTAGEFGNKHDPALLDPRTEDAHRRHHRLRRGQAVLLDDIGGALGRHRHRRGCRPIWNRTKGRFSGSLVSRLAPVEVEWPQREEIARASGEAGSIDYDTLLRTSGGGRFAQVHARYLFGSVADHLCENLRHKGIAHLGIDRLRVGRDGDPARRRGNTARRNQCCALRRDRRLHQCRGTGSVFSPVGVIDPQRRSAPRIETFLERPAGIRNG